MSGSVLLVARRSSSERSGGAGTETDIERSITSVFRIKADLNSQPSPGRRDCWTAWVRKEQAARPDRLRGSKSAQQDSTASRRNYRLARPPVTA